MGLAQVLQFSMPPHFCPGGGHAVMFRVTGGGNFFRSVLWGGSFVTGSRGVTELRDVFACVISYSCPGHGVVGTMGQACNGRCSHIVLIRGTVYPMRAAARMGAVKFIARFIPLRGLAVRGLVTH